MKELVSVFNMISVLKNIKKQPYIIDSEDMFIIYNYWNIYGLKKHISLKKFRKAVVNYSIISGTTLHNACECLSKKIRIE